MLSKENTKEQVADDQMDYLELAELVVEAVDEDILSSKFQRRMSCEFQESPGPSSANSGSTEYGALTNTVDGISLTDNEVVEKAIFFVKTFVREFEEKLSRCYEEVKPGSKMKKAGKIVDKCKSILNDSITSGPWKPALKEASECMGSFAAERHKEKEKKFYSAVLPFKDKQREVLVEAGLEVFQKFEKQFAQIIDIYSLFSWKEEVLKLAIDAVSRARNYISNINEVEKFSVDLVTQGVVLGQSKESFPISYFKDQMEDEEFSEASSTSLLYKKVGIKIIEGNTAKYYQLKEDNYGEKYGYRLLFAWESENWEEIKEKYVLSETPKEEYESILGNERKEKLASFILKEINGEDLVRQGYIDKCNKDYYERKRDISFEFPDTPTHFIKRKKVIGELNTMFHSKSQEKEMSRVVLVSGKSGTGKSTLAGDYGFRERRKRTWAKIMWINASSHISLSGSFYRLAEELFTFTEARRWKKRSIQSVIEEIYTYLRYIRSFFVFDNAKSYSEIEKFLPSNFPNVFSNGEKPFVLITSCNENLEWKGIKEIKLGNFDPEESDKFFKKAFGEDKLQGALELGKALNYLPLALKQATSHISKTAHTEQNEPNISEYLEQYKEAMKESNPDLLLALGISEELHTTLKTNFDKIEKEENAKQRLHDVYTIMTCFDRNHINIDKFSFQRKSRKDKQQISDTLNLFNIVSMTDLRKSIAKVHKEPIRVEEEETLRGIMISLVNSGITSMNHIVSIWSHVSKYDKLVNEFIGSTYDNGCSILHLLAANDSKEVIKLILEKVDSSKLRESINAVDRMGFTPLCYASMRGNLDIVKHLIEKGADLKRDNSYFIPLHCATIFGQLEVIQYFINNKYFELDELDIVGSTSLHYAVMCNQLDTVKYLVEKKANVNLQNEDNMSPLHFAVKNGRLDIVKYLVEKGASVNLQDKDYMSPLHYAAKNGHLDIVKYLIEEKADVSLQDEDDMSPLHYAAKNGHLDIVKYLVERGVDVSLKNEDGMSPLHFAAENGRLDIIKYFVEEGIDINLQSKDGMSSLHFAAENGRLDIVEYFIERGANVNLRDKDYMSPLHFAVLNGYLEIAKSLIDGGANMNLQDKDYMSPLHFAAKNGHLDIVKYFVKIGANMNLQDETYMSPLHYAAKNGHLDIVEYFIERGVDVDLRDGYGMSSLHYAAESNHLNIVKYLVEEKADVSLQDVDGMSPLHYAAENGHLEVTKYLVKEGANMNLQDKDYMSPLHFAVLNGHFNIIKYFVERGVDVSLKNEDGVSPLHFAAENGRLDIIKYFVEEGIDINLQSKDGMSSLHFAAENGRLDIVEYFIERGANVNLRDKDYMSPLHFAVLNGYLEIAKSLIDGGANINLQNGNSMNPLHFAAENGHLDIIKYFIKEVVDINQQDEDGMSFLHYAAKNGHLDIVKYFVGKGADINIKDRYGMKPLHYAAKNGHFNIAEYLVRMRFLVSSASDLKVQSDKRQQKVFNEYALSKKIKLENVSVAFEEDTSNIQLLQGSQGILSNISMQFEGLVGRMKDMVEESMNNINSEMPACSFNSIAVESVNNKNLRR